MVNIKREKYILICLFLKNYEKLVSGSVSSSFAKMATSGKTKPLPVTVKLNPIEATPETFQEFGQVIEASPDGEEFGPRDAQLDLRRGIPRFNYSKRRIFFFFSKL